MDDTSLSMNESQRKFNIQDFLSRFVKLHVEMKMLKMKFLSTFILVIVRVDIMLE